MPSHLRLQSDFEPFSAETTRTYFVASPPQKKQKMSLTQTYYIASSARSKLGREACKPDHDLRLLVGHANLLDSLMLELQHAEREQEAWYNSHVRRMEAEEEEEEQRHQQPRHVQWAEPIMEDDDEMDDSASDISDTDSESDLEEDFQMAIPIGRLRMPAVTVTTAEVEEDYEDDSEYEDEEFGAELMRVPSNQPPELVLDDESDDESPPASPPQPNLDFDEAQRKQAIATTGFYSTKPLSPSQQHALLQDGFFIPERNNNNLLIATC